MLDPLVALPAYAAVVILHELIHYAAARAAGIRGLRLVLDARRAVIGFTFSEASLRGFAAALLAPQALTIALLAVYAATGDLLALALGLANLAGGAPDLVNAWEALTLSTRYAALRATREGYSLVPRVTR